LYKTLVCHPSSGGRAGQRITRHAIPDTLVLIEVPVLPGAAQDFPANTIEFRARAQPERSGGRSIRSPSSTAACAAWNARTVEHAARAIGRCGCRESVRRARAELAAPGPRLR